MINDFVKHHFLSAVNEDLNVDWGKSGLPLETEIKINNKAVKPYSLALGVVDSWIESVKNTSRENIETSANKKIFDVAFNRMAKKIFPSLIPYIMPTVKFDGKNVIEGKDITPEQFWNEAWPKVWGELSAPERLLLKKYTILNPETKYSEVMNGFASALDQYDAYKPIIANEANMFYEMLGNAFSSLFGNEKVSLSNNMITSFFSDLNSRLSGGKIKFNPQKEEEVEGDPKDVAKEISSPEAKKTYAEVIKRIEGFDISKAKSTGDTTKSDTEGSKESDGDKDSQPAYSSIPKDPQSLRKWARTLNKVDLRVIIDTLRSEL